MEAGKAPLAPPTRTGFGTRLIDMNIKHELGGSIVRTTDGGWTWQVVAKDRAARGGNTSTREVAFMVRSGGGGGSGGSGRTQSSIMRVRTR